MKITRNKLTAIIGLALALTMIVGTLAYFTDRVETQASVTTMDDNGVDINFEPDPEVVPDDPSNPDPDDFEDPTPNDNTDDLSNWWAFLNPTAKVNFNPGDKMVLNFKLANDGELDVDVRETFIVTSSVKLSETPEFRLFNSFTKAANGANTGGNVVVTETRLNDYQYKYTIASYSITSGDAAAKAYYLVFDVAAANAFQGATCTVDYVAEAKQHTDGGDADWVTAATATLTVGGQNLNVVPKA